MCNYFCRFYAFLHFYLLSAWFYLSHRFVFEWSGLENATATAVAVAIAIAVRPEKLYMIICSSLKPLKYHSYPIIFSCSTVFPFFSHFSGRRITHWPLKGLTFPATIAVTDELFINPYFNWIKSGSTGHGLMHLEKQGNILKYLWKY